MYISKNGLELIKEFEGCILQSYDDYNNRIVNAGDSWTGTLTIGWGHIEGVYAGQTISQQEADNMLINDMGTYCNNLDEVINEGVFGFGINQNMYDALVSFGYNLGQGCLRTLGDGRDKQTVADVMLEYRNKGSVWEQGLLRRRNAERDLFLSNGDGGEVISHQESYETEENPIIRGSRFVGDRVLELQQLLIENGYDCGGFGADNSFGQGTYSSLIQYQRANNLSVDGLAGEQVFGSLYSKREFPVQVPQEAPQSEGRYWVGRIQQLCNEYGMNISVDNLWGSETENAVSNLPLCGIPYSAPSATCFVQERLGVSVDGVFMDESASAVGEYQSNHGIECDQIVGFQTYKSLCLED